MPKIVQYNLPPGGTVTQVADATSSALLVEGVDDLDYIQIDTTNSAEKLLLAGGGAKVGIGDSAPAALLGIKANATSGDWFSVRDSAGPEKCFVVSTANGDDGIATIFKDGLAQHSINGGSGVVFNDQGLAGTDFRVESDSNTHMLFVDGGANAIGINQSSADAPLHIVGVGGDTGKAWSTGGDSPTMIIENSDGSSKNRCLLALNGDGSSGSSVDLYHQDTRLAGLAGYPGNASVYGQAVTLTLEATGANVVILKTNSKARMTIAAAGTVEIIGGLDVQGAGEIVSISTATVTGDGSAVFLTKFAPGSAVKFTNDADATEIRTVLSVSANDTMILTETPGATGSGRTTKTYFHDPDLFEIKSGDGLSRLKYDALGQLTVCNTAQNNVIVSDGKITQMTGASNTIIGGDQKAAISVSNRTTIGHRAGKGMTGASLTAVGQSSGESDAGSSGAEVTLVGYFSGNVGPGNTTVAVGTRALSACQSGGGGNVAVGGSAGIAITTGGNNTCVGNGSNAAAAVDNQIAIGYGSVTDGVNKMRLGNATLATADIKVDWTVDSDERIKENVQDADAGLGFVNALRPVSFTRKHPAEWPGEIREKIYTQGSLITDGEGNETRQSTPQFNVDTQQPIKDEFDDTSRVDGLLAQEVKAAAESLGVSFNGVNEAANGKLGIQYATLVVPLIKAVQELTARIEELENGE